jgi:hypothetical protein
MNRGDPNSRDLNFQGRLRFLAKQVAWIIIFVLMSTFCTWGIYTSIQYMYDPCVLQSGPYGIALDWWLIAIATFNLIFAVVVLVLLCCQTRRHIRRWVIWPMHIINVLWNLLGVMLLVESNLRCQHNNLWVASLVNVSLTGVVAVLLLSVWSLNHFGLCSRLGRYISLEDTPYDDYQILQTSAQASFGY